MHAAPPSRRSPPADGGLSPVVTVALLLAAAGLVAAGVHVGMAYFAAPGDAAFGVDGCNPQADIVRVRLVFGGPLPFRALEVSLENASAGRTEVTGLVVEDDGRWENGGVYPFGSGNDPDAKGVEWDLASQGGLDNTSQYRLTIHDRDKMQPRPLAVLGFDCRSS